VRIPDHRNQGIAQEQGERVSLLKKRQRQRRPKERREPKKDHRSKPVTRKTLSTYEGRGGSVSPKGSRGKDGSASLGKTTGENHERNLSSRGREGSQKKPAYESMGSKKERKDPSTTEIASKSENRIADASKHLRKGVGSGINSRGKKKDRVGRRKLSCRQGKRKPTN